MKYKTTVKKVGEFTVTMHTPIRTPKEQAIRDREIKESLINIYRQLEAEGKAEILLKDKN